MNHIKIKRTAILLLVCCLLTGTALGAQTPVISAETVSGAAGETVTVPVNIRQNSGLAGWMLEIRWDPAVLSLSAPVAAGEAFPTGTLLPKETQDGGLRVFWYSAKNAGADGEMLSLTFRIADSAKNGDYAVTVQVSADNTVDETGAPVPVLADSGSVKVAGKDPQPGEGPDAPVPGQPAGPAEPSAPETGVPPLFPDVPDGHWAKGPIETLAKRGIVCGSGGLFYPERKLTRAEFVKMLAGVLSADVSEFSGSAFADVPEGHWASGYIAWAAEKGFVKGADAAHFLPDAQITREQIAVILRRCAEKVSLALPSGKRQSVFADEGQISAYAKSAVAVIADAGLISGYPDGAFRPQGSASRAETAKLLVGFLEILEEE